MSVEEPPSRTPHEFSDWWRATGEHELRQLLFWVWDPIGVEEHFPVTADEYDTYAIEVATVLASGASVPVLAEFLHATARDRMGLTAPRPDAVAAWLHQWYRQSRDRTARGRFPLPLSDAVACEPAGSSDPLCRIVTPRRHLALPDPVQRPVITTAQSPRLAICQDGLGSLVRR